jgi:hypothetical protein
VKLVSSSSQCIYKFSFRLTENTFKAHYKDEEISRLFLIHFSIIMASKLKSSECYLPSSFPIKLSVHFSGFGRLEVACWPLVHKFEGSQPAEAVGILGRKNSQHAFLWRGSRAVRRSHVVALRHVKDPQNVT